MSSLTIRDIFIECCTKHNKKITQAGSKETGSWFLQFNESLGWHILEVMPPHSRGQGYRNVVTGGYSIAEFEKICEDLVL